MFQLQFRSVRLSRLQSPRALVAIHGLSPQPSDWSGRSDHNRRCSPHERQSPNQREFTSHNLFPFRELAQDSPGLVPPVGRAGPASLCITYLSCSATHENTVPTLVTPEAQSIRRYELIDAESNHVPPKRSRPDKRAALSPGCQAACRAQRTG
jgi:hypothetical protein